MENSDLPSINAVTDLIVAFTPKLVGALITLVIGFWIIAKITRIFRLNLDKRNIDKEVHTFLSSLVNMGLKILLLLAVSNMVGIATTSFVAILGALAFAVGMALQGSLGHFASGIMLLISRPYKVGDLVDIAGGNIGHVEALQIFNTVLKTLDNKKIFIPNGLVTNNVITNISGQGDIGVELVFGIGYTDDIDKAKEIILEVGKNCPYILDKPKHEVFVGELGDNSVNLATRPFCKSEDYWAALFYMQEHVKKEFDKAGISIPYPQLDVHMVSP